MIFLNTMFVHPIDQKFPAKVKHEKLNNFFHEPMSMLFFCENVASIDTKKITKGIFDNWSHAWEQLSKIPLVIFLVSIEATFSQKDSMLIGSWKKLLSFSCFTFAGNFWLIGWKKIMFKKLNDTLGLPLGLLYVLVYTKIVPKRRYELLNRVLHGGGAGTVAT